MSGPAYFRRGDGAPVSTLIVAGGPSRDHDGGLLHLLPLKAARTAPVFHDKLRSDEKICYNYCQKNNS